MSRCVVEGCGETLGNLELNDSDIMNLDDILPRLLLKFGIDCT